MAEVALNLTVSSEAHAWQTSMIFFFDHPEALIESEREHFKNPFSVHCKSKGLFDREGGC